MKITLIIKYSWIFFTPSTDEFTNIKTDVHLYSKVQISNSQVVIHFMCKVDIAYLLCYGKQSTGSMENNH